MALVSKKEGAHRGLDDTGAGDWTPWVTRGQRGGRRCGAKTSELGARGLIGHFGGSLEVSTKTEFHLLCNPVISLV